MIATDLQSLITAMADCKAALTEQGLTLDRNPRLTDLPALINAIGEGTTPALSEVQPRDLTTNLNLIAPTLKEIETALTNKGVDVGGVGSLKISNVASKIREIVVSKDVTFEIFSISNSSSRKINNLEKLFGWGFLSWISTADGNIIKIGTEETEQVNKTSNGTIQYYAPSSRDNAISYLKRFVANNNYPNPYTDTTGLYRGSYDIVWSTCTFYSNVTLPIGSYHFIAQKVSNSSFSGRDQDPGITIDVTPDKEGKKFICYAGSANGYFLDPYSEWI